ncbi:MAG: MotA/TolQ/ExbB proton channel family protein [Deltaproteobacteria bacterium]|nr:MotA/TolQ/ExbB proton channel family protein [Deltaproteobacteria bacterium]
MSGEVVPIVEVHVNGIEARMLELFLYMGSQWVLYILLFLSVIAFAIAFERLLHFFQTRENLENLSKQLSKCLNTDDLAGARKLLEQSRSHMAKVALRGLDGLNLGSGALEEVIAGATQIERLKMERGLAFLGTLGNNAPFVGLFGTVLGIIRAFRDLSINTIEGSAAVMAGIAEALVATAVGLLVALPAVALFNTFQRHIRTKLAGTEALTRELLAHAKRNI